MSSYTERQRDMAHHKATAVQEKAMDYIQDMNKVIAGHPHEPWNDEVKKYRDRARNHFVGILFNYPSSPLAQTVDDVWVHTTHSYLKALTTEAHNAESNLQTWKQYHKERHGSCEKRLWNAWKQYRIIVNDDIAFYKELIDRIVRFYNIHDVVDDVLELIDIPVSHEASEDGRLPVEFTDVERKSTTIMVYEILYHLGDFERYLKQLDDLEYGSTAPRNPNAKQLVERKHTSEDYYQAAVNLIPDNGHAYNSLAVVHTAAHHDLKTIYYHTRAATARRPFKHIDDIIYKKAHSRMLVITGRTPQSDQADPDQATSAIKMYVDLMALINCNAYPVEAHTLAEGAASELADALAERLVPSDDLVKVTICLIGTHYRVRQLATVKSTKRGQDDDRQIAKEAALAAVTLHFRALCELGTWELSQCDGPSVELGRVNGNEMSASQNGSTDRHDMAKIEGLADQLSSVLRRMLPSFRILSKWLKSNVAYLRRHVERSKWGHIGELWTEYSRFVTKLAQMFPISDLPSMMGSLEEDIELRGFVPLSKTVVSAKRFEARSSDEEHLMRVSDLSIDAVMIIQQAVDYDFIGVKVLEVLQDLNRQVSDDSEDVQAGAASETVVESQETQSAGAKSHSHSRGTSKSTDDDDEEIVYTPLVAKAAAMPKAGPAPATVVASASADVQRGSSQAPRADSAPLPAPAPAPAPAAAAASAVQEAPARAITAMDLVEQMGRQYPHVLPSPLEPPLPIVPPTARHDGPPPGFSQPLVVKHAGSGPGFNNPPNGRAPHPGPPPGFHAQQPVRRSRELLPGMVRFPHHTIPNQGLFGAVATEWTLTRSESQQGIERSISQSSQPRPEHNDAHAHIPRVHSQSSLLDQDVLDYSNLSMSRSISQPAQPRPYPVIAPPVEYQYNKLLWPIDFRDDLFLLAGRPFPIRILGQ